MKIFEQTFGRDVYVSVTAQPDGETLLRVYSKRPDPSWLRTRPAKKRNSARPVRQVATEAELREGLLRLIRALPGRGRTFYEQARLHEGGVNGSQDRKERVLDSLLTSGEVVIKPLAKAQGRRSHGVYPSGGKEL